MAGLCEGGNEPSGSLKSICKKVANQGETYLPAGVLALQAGLPLPFESPFWVLDPSCLSAIEVFIRIPGQHPRPEEWYGMIMELKSDGMVLMPNVEKREGPEKNRYCNLVRHKCH
ncbi:hypothetical protein ANN_06145 [Periplaneta americana]|uniref:Uncharacterized protein n=1 Tax=Periplaneta americana TaxID=6978 RepID=A0ABQ8TDM7_PERAM|nr:hypothetical protein ANN_06145 [Periplaneta americana]